MKRKRVEEDILRVLRLRIKSWLRKPSKIAITAIKRLLRKLHQISLERLYSAGNQKGGLGNWAIQKKVHHN